MKANLSVEIRDLRSVDPLKDLTDAELKFVADRSELAVFDESETVFDQEGGNGKLYVVLDGEVLISKPTESDREIGIATFVGGESFGEMSLFDSQPAAALARAESETRLVIFPAGTEMAADVLKSEPAVQAKILHNLLVSVAGRIRSTNRLVAEKSPWVQELRRQVLVDKLTGLYNSSYLDEEYGKKFENRRDCIMVLKPDNFKVINDGYGHDAGDQVLRLLAKVIEQQNRGNDISLRYHGDVFAVILQETELPDARLHAEDVRTVISGMDISEITGSDASEPKDTSSRDSEISFTASVGLASYPDGGKSASELLERAYQNMLVARNRGGDRLCCAQKSRLRTKEK